MSIIRNYIIHKLEDQDGYCCLDTDRSQPLDPAESVYVEFGDDGYDGCYVLCEEHGNALRKDPDVTLIAYGYEFFDDTDPDVLP